MKVDRTRGTSSRLMDGQRGPQHERVDQVQGREEDFTLDGTTRLEIWRVYWLQGARSKEDWHAFGEAFTQRGVLTH